MRVSNCEGCPLRGQPHVPPMLGGPGCIAIVGEAPGEDEVKFQRPFVGQSGQLLRTAVSKVVTGVDFHITNSCTCHPDKNKKPSSKAIRSCWPRLAKELQTAQPRLIMCFGLTAAEAVLGYKDTMIRFRAGNPHVIQTSYGPVPVYVTYHPAACLRNGDLYPDMIRDIRRALRPSEEKKGTWIDPEIKLLANPQNKVEFMTRIYNGKRVAIDIEATGLSAQYDPTIMIGFAIDTSTRSYVAVGEDEMNEALSILGAGAVKVGWQNGMFDIQHLYHMTGVWLPIDFDTMLAHYSLDERKGTHGLQYLASEYLGAPVFKDAGQLGQVSPALIQRNARDVSTTMQLWDLFEPMLESQGLSKLHDFLCKAAHLLAKVEYQGVMVNLEYLDNLNTTMGGEVTSIKAAITDKYGINPNSTQQLARLLYDELKLKPVAKNHSTDKKARKKLKGKHPIIEQIDAYKTISKEWSTYVKGIRSRQVEGVIYARFNLHTTATGRLSSTNPNLQNIKRGSRIRDIIQARPGYKLVQLDYSQAELRVGALLSNDTELLHILREGTDLHDEVSLLFFGPGFTKEQRVIAKNVNFGIFYGITEYGLADQIQRPVAEARRYIDTWLARFLGVKRLQETTRGLLISKGEIEQPLLGRKRRFHLVTNSNIETLVKEGVNFPIQSTASDLTLHAAMRADDEMRSIGARLVILVHDSLTYEVPEENVDLAIPIIRRVGMSVADLLDNQIELPVDIEVGYKWGSMKKVN